MERTYWEYDLIGTNLLESLNKYGKKGWEAFGSIGSSVLIKRQIPKPQPMCVIDTRKPTMREATAAWLRDLLRGSVKHV